MSKLFKNLKKFNNKIALIGFNGFVGSIIYKYLRIHNLNVIGINRDNYNKYITSVKLMLP